MKHYIDIQRLNTKFADAFRVGDYITITEKIDGANFSIKYDPETDRVKAFSRKQELSFGNNLRGAWDWAQKLDKGRVHAVLGDNLILFGEWLVSHSVPYPDDKYGKPYFFDLYDASEEIWCSHDEALRVVNALGLEFVPIFYVGQFTSWDDVRSYVGRTDLGGEYGEGVVVKNQTRLNDPNNRLPFYTKIVGERFAEKAERKIKSQPSAEKMAREAELNDMVASIVTPARVEKMVNKFVDEGLIPEDWDARDMGTIAKNLGRRIYEDCVKEEPDTVNEVGDSFGKRASSLAMAHVRTKMLNA